MGSTIDWPDLFLKVGFEPLKPSVLKQRLKGGTLPPFHVWVSSRFFSKISSSCCIPRFIQKQREVTMISRRAPQERGPESGGLFSLETRLSWQNFFLQGVSPFCVHVAGAMSSEGHCRDASVLRWNPSHMSFYTSGSQWGHFYSAGDIPQCMEMFRVVISRESASLLSVVG